VDLSQVAVVDGHCHALLPDPTAATPDEVLELLSESRPGTMTSHVLETGYFRRTLRELARRVGAGPTLEAVLAQRRARGQEAACRTLADSRVAALLVDTGYPPLAMPLAEMGRLLPCAVHEVFRIETCAQALLGRALPYDLFLDTFRREIREAAERAVALKSVIAYRSGLAVRDWSAEEPARAYRAARARVAAGGSARLTEKPLLDTLFLIALETCRDIGRPLQLHTGFGDPDVDLLEANPLLLRPLLEDPRWREARLVLLHLAYPYAREAAFVASVWPQVSVDLSLTLPFLGSGAVPLLVEVLSLAPATKLLYGSDVRGLPELYALAADWARGALGEALGWLVARGDLSEADARTIGARVLGGNAAALYGPAVALPGPP
jgi:uncharacterized protein